MDALKDPTFRWTLAHVEYKGQKWELQFVSPYHPAVVVQVRNAKKIPELVMEIEKQEICLR